MAENPKFNNSDMFNNVNDSTHNDINAKNASEVLATQGNVINSIKTFWNKLRAKLAYAISRPDYAKQVGGYYVPIFVDADGVVQECQPTTVQADIASDGIITIPTKDIPNDNIYTGTTVCISFSNNSASSSTNNLQIKHNNSTSPVKYPSGVTVLAKDMSSEGLLLATFCKNSTSSNNNFWILLNKINTVVSTGQTTSNGSGNGGHPGLMTAEDKAKLDTIKWSANNYILPKATNNSLGGIQLGYTNNGNDKNYKLQTDNEGNGYVNVPWTDTTYTLLTASSSTLGGVKLGADKLSDLDTPSAGNTNNRYYPIQTDKNDKLVVNVPWQNTHNTATLRVGNNNNTNNESTTNGNMYLKIVDGSNVSSLKISGSGDTTVISDTNGNITINSPKVNSYSKLDSSNNNPSLGYLIKGSNSNSTDKFLAGNGTWVKGRLVPNNGSNGQILKWGTNGPYWDNAD